MALLNRKVDYALLILCYLHHRSGGGCAREIAEHFGLSKPFVANILKDLCHKGYVASHRGVKGGYLLQPETEQVSLAELLDSLDHSIRLAECNAPCPEESCSLAPSCPIRGPIADVNHRIRQVLTNVTLAEIFGKHAMSAMALPVTV